MVSLAPSGIISNRLDAQIKCANVTINSHCVINMYALHKASDYEEINMTPKGFITTPKAVGPFLCFVTWISRGTLLRVVGHRQSRKEYPRFLWQLWPMKIWTWSSWFWETRQCKLQWESTHLLCVLCITLHKMCTLRYQNQISGIRPLCSSEVGTDCA